ncbi:MAG: SHD1 domain-containing protein [Planctomycetota bacterium]|nr:SHD1 domain-containing protein [Planctomycetota bacterium]
MLRPIAFKVLCGLVLCNLCAPIAWSKEREWVSANGIYKLKAEVVAFSDETVVLKKEDGKLVAVELSALCEKDNEFIKSKSTQESAKKSADEMQVWTGADGLKVRGRVLQYGKKKLVIARKRGKIMIGDKVLKDANPIQQKVLLKTISRIEKKNLETIEDLEEWAKPLRGQAKSYDVEGVLMMLETGDEVGVPFFMFSEKDLAVLKPGWDNWLAQDESEKERERESFYMRAQAMAYQRDRAAQKQVELLKLELLGAATGVTNIWQVGLTPARGRYGRPMVVMVSAPNSQAAGVQAMKRYPGYVVGGIRKANY